MDQSQERPVSQKTEAPLWRCRSRQFWQRRSRRSLYRLGRFKICTFSVSWYRPWQDRWIWVSTYALVVSDSWRPDNWLGQDLKMCSRCQQPQSPRCFTPHLLIAGFRGKLVVETSFRRSDGIIAWWCKKHRRMDERDLRSWRIDQSERTLDHR